MEIEFAALFICLAGESEIMLDMKAYHIQAGDLCVIFPHSVIQGIRKSEDFDGYAFGCQLGIHQHDTNTIDHDALLADIPKIPAYR